MKNLPLQFNTRQTILTTYLEGIILWKRITNCNRTIAEIRRPLSHSRPHRPLSWRPMAAMRRVDRMFRNLRKNRVLRKNPLPPPRCPREPCLRLHRWNVSWKRPTANLRPSMPNPCPMRGFSCVPSLLRDVSRGQNTSSLMPSSLSILCLWRMWPTSLQR